MRTLGVDGANSEKSFWLTQYYLYDLVVPESLYESKCSTCQRPLILGRIFRLRHALKRQRAVGPAKTSQSADKHLKELSHALPEYVSGWNPAAVRQSDTKQLFPSAKALSDYGRFPTSLALGSPCNRPEIAQHDRNSPQELPV